MDSLHMANLRRAGDRLAEFHHYAMSEACRRAGFRITELEAELAAERERREAAEKDAARYQWLKINARRIDFAGLCVSDGAQLDARIDAARKD